MSVYGVLVTGSTRNDDDENNQSWVGKFCPDEEDMIGIELFKSEKDASSTMKHYSSQYSYRVVRITPFICKRIRNCVKRSSYSYAHLPKFMELLT